MKKLIYFFTLLTTINSFAQFEIVRDDVSNIGQLLINLQGDLSFGNGCESLDIFIDCEIEDRINLNFHNLEVMKARVTCYGIDNEGEITFLCNESEIVIQEPTLFVSEETFSDSLEYYPNPVEDFLTIKGKDFYSIEIYDVIGRKVKSFLTPFAMNNIDFRNDRSGAYIVVVTGKNNQRETFKIIKK